MIHRRTALVAGALVSLAGCTNLPVTPPPPQPIFNLTPLQWSMILDVAGLENLVALEIPTGSGNIFIRGFTCGGAPVKPHDLKKADERAAVLELILKSKAPTITFDTQVRLDCLVPKPVSNP